MEFYKKVEYDDPEGAKRAVRDALEEYKLVHLVGFDFSADVHEYFAAFGDFLGLVINMAEDRETGVRTGGRWLDISYDPARPNKYRSSNTRQPFHTDNSYLPHNDAVNYFYCVSHAQVGGATFFLDGDLLVRVLELDGERCLLEDLRSIPVRFSKQGSSKTRPILTEDESGLRLNYNYYCLDEGNSPEAKELVGRFQHFLESRVQNSGIALALPLKRGDAVFFHDERLLHGRNAFFASGKGDRVLLKGSLVLPSRKHKNPGLDFPA